MARDDVAECAALLAPSCLSEVPDGFLLFHSDSARLERFLSLAASRTQCALPSITRTFGIRTVLAVSFCASRLEAPVICLLMPWELANEIAWPHDGATFGTLLRLVVFDGAGDYFSSLVGSILAHVHVFI